MTPDLTKPMRWKSDHTPVIVLWSDDNDTFAEWQPPDDEPVRQHMRTEWFSERVENIPPEPVGPEEVWINIYPNGFVTWTAYADKGDALDTVALVNPSGGASVRYIRADIATPKGEIERLRAELGAQRARANENELCAAAVVEIRRLCKEIMGGNLSFVDDDFARCLLTLRDERDALAAENSAFGKAMQKVRPLTEEEYAALLKGFYNGGHGITEAFNAVMAARGIEVGE